MNIWNTMGKTKNKNKIKNTKMIKTMRKMINKDN